MDDVQKNEDSNFERYLILCFWEKKFADSLTLLLLHYYCICNTFQIREASW